jgi:hypothetical protein
MAERQPGPYDSVARKWLALAERRRAHMFELRDSGRWKHYYTSAQLLDAISDAVLIRDRWAQILTAQDFPTPQDLSTPQYLSTSQDISMPQDIWMPGENAELFA